ncbi:MAG: VOC family protein [Treponema sp.]
MTIHHVGFLTKNIKKSEKEFLNLGFNIEQTVQYDSIRKINIEFIVNGDYRIELIEPVDKDSPMYPLLKRYKNTPYHFCYISKNLYSDIEYLTKLGGGGGGTR